MIEKITKLIRKNMYFIRFVMVGGFNTLNYFITFRLLLLVLPYLAAHITAFLFSAFVSYFLTCMFTFKQKPSWSSLVRFPLTFLPNLILSSFGTVILVQYLHVPDQWASLIMMICIIPITFIINKLIFLSKKETEVM